MNKPIWVARLLSVGGVLEICVGLALFVDPAGGWSLLLGSSLDAPGVVVGRIGGAALLALGIAYWCARKTPTALASLGVAWAYVTFNVIACATLVHAAIALAGGGLPTFAAALLHGTLGAAMLAALLARGSAPAES